MLNPGGPAVQTSSSSIIDDVYTPDEVRRKINETSKEVETVMKITSTLHHPDVIKILSGNAEIRLNSFISIMPEGRFLNHHNEKFERCDGIVLLASGEVCPIFRDSVGCLNQLIRNDDYAALSTFSVAGDIIPDYNSLTKTVEKYNKDLSERVSRCGVQSLGRHMIIAYHSFVNGW